MNRNSCPGMFFKKGKGKHLCQSLFLNKVAGLRPTTLLKKRLWHRSFQANFVKFFRTPSVAASERSSRGSWSEMAGIAFAKSFIIIFNMILNAPVSLGKQLTWLHEIITEHKKRASIRWILMKTKVIENKTIGRNKLSYSAILHCIHLHFW